MVLAATMTWPRRYGVNVDMMRRQERSFDDERKAAARIALVTDRYAAPRRGAWGERGLRAWS
jgi:phage gp46-like protein